MNPVLKSIVLIFFVVGIGSLITSLIHYIKIKRNKSDENKD